MINKLPINNEADNLDQWNYNRGWNDAIEEIQHDLEIVQNYAEGISQRLKYLLGHINSPYDYDDSNN